MIMIGLGITDAMTILFVSIQTLTLATSSTYLFKIQIIQWKLERRDQRRRMEGWEVYNNTRWDRSSREHFIGNSSREQTFRYQVIDNNTLLQTLIQKWKEKLYIWWVPSEKRHIVWFEKKYMYLLLIGIVFFYFFDIFWYFKRLFGLFWGDGGMVCA